MKRVIAVILVLCMALALCACAFMVYAAFAGYGVTVLYYLVVYAAVMGIGWLFDRRKK